MNTVSHDPMADSDLSAKIDLRLVGGNPYPVTIPDETFRKIVRACVETRVRDFVARHAEGEYPWGSLGMVVLDRTAPYWMPTDKTVLFTARYGELGDLVVVNAAAKAFEHRDHGVEAGALSKTMPGRLKDGAFRYGCSAVVDGTYVGVSGAEEFQDRHIGIALANDLNYNIDRARLAWHTAHDGVWFDADDKPDARYAAVADATSFLSSGD